MKYPISKQRENAGLNYVRTTVNNCGAIFRTITESDIGIDGYIEFVDSEEATGFIVGAQVKSGTSYIDKEKHEYVIKSDLSHLRYWASSTIPIVGIVYDTERKVAGWIDLSQFAQEHLNSEQTSYTIRFPWTSQFDEGTFLKSFRHALEPYRTNSELVKVLESISSPELAKRLLGILALRMHRTSRVACLIFSNLLRDPDIDMRRLAITWFSTYLPHPDILWTDEFKPATGELREYATFLAKSLDRGVIQLMLEAIDENGLNRGGVGECVWVILLEIPLFRSHLVAIASDVSASKEARFYSIGLIGELRLNENIELLKRLKVSTGDSDLIEIINWALDSLEARV